MSKPEWGTKRVCHTCGARFYDLKKKPITCPKCHTTFDPEAFVKTKRRPDDKNRTRALLDSGVDAALLIDAVALDDITLADPSLLEDAGDLDAGVEDVIDEIDAVETDENSEE